MFHRNRGRSFFVLFFFLFLFLIVSFFVGSLCRGSFVWTWMFRLESMGRLF
jgi:hypothetical protein